MNFKYIVITAFGVEKHFLVGKILTFVYVDGKVLIKLRLCFQPAKYIVTRYLMVILVLSNYFFILFN